MKSAIATLCLVLALEAAASAQDVPRFGVFEASFSASGSPSNPYASVTATASLTGPDGATRTIPLFWDGGSTWRLRFSPHLTGAWTWSLSSGDGGLNGRTGSFSCVSSSAKGGIRARASHPYHFEHQNGAAFWWFGDTMWNAGERVASENLDRATFFHYVDVRAAQGFNYVHANFGRSPAVNEGGSMWDGTYGQKVRPGYFQEIDTRIKYMNGKGITAGFMLAWAQDWDDYGEAERLRYARYVVARYSAYNVLFIVAGEYNETLAADAYRKIGQEIRKTDPHRRMIAIHSTGTVEQFADETWMDFGDYQQIYKAPTATEATPANRRDLHNALLAARDHNKPVVNSEYAYYLRDMDGDGKVDKPNSHTRRSFRRASWVLAMAGGYFVTGFGTTYFGGVRDPGPFNVDDPRNDDAEADLVRIRTFFTSFEAWRLNPRNGLVSTPSGFGYALAQTGQTYAVFTEEAASASLGLGGAGSATYTVRRYDPRAGTWTNLPDYTGTGPISLSNPDAQDWAYLVRLKSASSNQPPTASLSANKTSVAPGENVTFSAAASDPDGTIASHVWNWGNATESGSGAPPATKTRSWSSAGTYAVSLQVTDNGGLSATSNTVTITVTANKPPVITAASATPNHGTAPLSVAFSADASDPEGQPLTYRWDFQGDGVFDATGKTATFTYTAAGHYDPVVEVSDGTNRVVAQLTVDVDAPSGGGSTLDFGAEADTYVYERNPTTNFGLATSVAVGGGTDRRIAWIRFNVTGLPSGAAVTDARLILTCTNASAEGGGTLRRFGPTSASWDETQPTWNSPLAGSDASGDLATLKAVASGAVVEIPGLAPAVAGNGRVTFVLRSPWQDGAAYASRQDATASRRPRLRVTYSTSTAPFSVRIDSVSTGKAYSLSSAQAGALYYIDRSFTITSLPSDLAGHALIRTANDDKLVTAAAHLAFTVSQAADVFVAYDKRATSEPAFLRDGTWTLTTTLGVSDGSASPMRVYRKSVSSGQVVLGGNHHGGATGAQSNYVVVVKGSAGTLARAMLADVWENPGDSDGDGLLDDFERAHGLDPASVDTSGSGIPDEAEFATSGLTWWEEQQRTLGGGTSSNSGGGACGALGLETLLLAAACRRKVLRRLLRRTP